MKTCMEATAWLESLGYDGFFIRNRAFHPVRDFQPDLQRPENALQPDGSQLGEYIWKFVFGASVAA
jgi:hypothetical protein